MAMFGGGDSAMTIVIKAKDEASKVFDDLTKKYGKTVKNLGKIGTAAAGVGVVLGKQAVDAAMSFEKSMSNVGTLLDTTTEDMEKMKKEVLDMSTRTPVALDELSEALYDVRSAGIDAGGAMQVLENSARLGVAGLGTTKEATDIVTSAINAFGISSTDSARVADVFFKTVKSGKTNISELSQGFGQLAPLAESLGISFEEVMSTTAAMTTSGLKASVAYTQQRAVMSNLLKPTQAMRDLMDKVGISNIKTEIASEGLTGTLAGLNDAAVENNIGLEELFGSVEALNAVTMLMGETGVQQTSIFGDMTNGANSLDEAMKKQNETYQAQYQVLKNQIGKYLIYLGVKILPLVKTGIENGIMIVKEWKLWFDSLADTIGGVIFKLMEAYEWAKKAFNKAKEVVTGGEKGVPGVPFFEHGGTVPGPRGAVVPIMAHGQEQIIPANQARSGGGGVSLTINNPVFRNNEDERRMKQQLDQYFRPLLQNHKISF